MRNYLLAIRHPVETLRNLVFCPEPMCVYTSFPITRTRKSIDCINEINNFRSQLHDVCSRNGVALFDPVTIDELILKLALDRVPEGESRDVLLSQDMRWPLGENRFVSEPGWPIRVPGEEIQEAADDIVNNIKARDFKLIDNSVLTVAYRPNFCGPSEGVKSEIDYSIAQGKRVLVYERPEDKEGVESHPFDQPCVPHDSLPALLADVEKTIKGWQQRAKGRRGR